MHQFVHQVKNAEYNQCDGSGLICITVMVCFCCTHCYFPPYLLICIFSHCRLSSLKGLRSIPDVYKRQALQKVLESFPDDLAVCQLMPDNQGMDAVLQRHEQTAQVLFLSTWSNSCLLYTSVFRFRFQTPAGDERFLVYTLLTVTVI